MFEYNSNNKNIATALILLSVTLLFGCERPTTTQTLDPSSFNLGATITYHPSTGAGAVIIGIEYPAFLSTDSGLDLGRGDAIVITSGEHSTAITSVPMGFTRQSITIDPTRPLKLEFVRGNDVLQKYEMSIDERLFPRIEPDTTVLDSSVNGLNAAISFGIETPYELVGDTSFNYGALLTQCTTEDGMVELGRDSLLMDYSIGLNRSVGSVLDETTLNPNIDARFLVFAERENLNTAFYISCETNLFSYIELGGDSPLVTYFEEGDMEGNLRAVLISDPVSVRVENSAIGFIEN